MSIVYLQILCVDGVDSSPCVVVTTENHRYMFDVGEGVQRLCVEHKVRLSKLNCVFLTQLRPETVCGLPGLCLTSADAKVSKGGIDIYGPKGIGTFWKSTRHFMCRPAFSVRTIEATEGTLPSNSLPWCTEGELRVEALIITPSHSHLSYLCSTPGTVGKFDVSKAQALGVPKGPLFGKLKSGQSITLENGDVVLPTQVLGPSEKGRICIIVCNVDEDKDKDKACYSNDNDNESGSSNRIDRDKDKDRDKDSIPLLDLLVSNAGWNKVQVGGELSDQVDCIVHLSPLHVIDKVEYKAFMSKFNKNITHIMAGAGACLPISSFIAATLYNNKLHKICDKIFPKMRLSHPTSAFPTFSPPLQAESSETPIIVAGGPLLRFILTPSRRRGLDVLSDPDSINTRDVDRLHDNIEEQVETFLDTHPKKLEMENMSKDIADILHICQNFIQEQGQGQGQRLLSSVTSISEPHLNNNTVAAEDVSMSAMSAMSATMTSNLDLSNTRCKELLSDNFLWFLGTGSAIPSKYRNVSGILLHLAHSDSSILIDAGEGTWQQLMRMSINRTRQEGDKPVDATSSLHASTSSVSPPKSSSTVTCTSVSDHMHDHHNDVATKLAKQLKVIWISHPHADHHLGLIRILAERKRLLMNHNNAIHRFTPHADDHGIDETDASTTEFQPLILIAPASVLAFMRECEQVCQGIKGSYIPVSNRLFDPQDSCVTADVYWGTKSFTNDTLAQNSDGTMTTMTMTMTMLGASSREDQVYLSRKKRRTDVKELGGGNQDTLYGNEGFEDQGNEVKEVDEIMRWEKAEPEPEPEPEPEMELCAEVTNSVRGMVVSYADRPDVMKTLQQCKQVLHSMGIASLQNVKVEHCRHAYGLILTGIDNSNAMIDENEPRVVNSTSEQSSTQRLTQSTSPPPPHPPPMKLVYSGDTRPCKRLSRFGKGATILIHEATFDDSNSSEAIAKRHSTISEAYDIAREMGAFRLILTHFSQRYQGVPPLPHVEDGLGVVAFDYMSVSFKDLLWAPALKKLICEAFPSQSEEEGDDEEEG